MLVYVKQLMIWKCLLFDQKHLVLQKDVLAKKKVKTNKSRFLSLFNNIKKKVKYFHHQRKQSLHLHYHV